MNGTLSTGPQEHGPCHNKSGWASAYGGQGGAGWPMAQYARGNLTWVLISAFTCDFGYIRTLFLEASAATFLILIFKNYSES